MSYTIAARSDPEVQPILALAAEKVNASVRTIKEHYDQQSMRDEMEHRRREYVDRLTFESQEGSDK